MLYISLIFQFHKGTIKTGLSTALAGEQSVFQFHKGTIKTQELSSMYSTHANFNSIKVQLRPKGSSRSRLQSFQFQFHKGTIKTQQRSTCSRQSLISIP